MQETSFLPHKSPPVKQPRRPLWRGLSISAAAAVVLLTILSWVVLSYGFPRSTHHLGAPNGQTTVTGVTQAKIHTGTLVCSVPNNNSTAIFSQQPTLDWSSRGQIAATYDNLKTFSAPDCSSVHANAQLQFQAQQVSWSPDGKRLLIQDSQQEGTFRAEVLNASTGAVIASFHGSDPGDFVIRSAWSPDGTQVISEVLNYPTKYTSREKVQIWNASSGALIRTALTFTSGVQNPGGSQSVDALSPDGKYFAVGMSNNSVAIWDIASGKRVSSIPFNQSAMSALAWSANGAFLALGLPDASEVQVWATATGRLVASFHDSDSREKAIGSLSWSPDGHYLAESASNIHIWDMQTQKIIATFDNLDSVHWEAALVWSPQGTMLASSTIHIPTGVHLYALNQSPNIEDTVKLWKLT